MKSMSTTSLKPSVSQAAQRGFALVSAIFLLVVLAALGAFMVTMSTVQHTTSAQDVQGSRAYHAARAGIEWGIYLLMVPENANPFVAGNRATCAAIPAAVPPAGNLVLGGTLTGFTVTVTCASTDTTEADNTIRVFTLTSDATFGAVGTTGYSARRISATITTCRRTADGAQCT